MNISIKNILAYLTVVLAVVSVGRWGIIRFSNITISWMLYIVIIVVMLAAIKTYYLSSVKKELFYVKLYLGWVIICLVRGLFVAELYWDLGNGNLLCE